MPIDLFTDASFASLLGGSLLLGIGTLACIYHDRAVFDTARKDMRTLAGWPLVGSTPEIVMGLSRIHDYFISHNKHNELSTATTSAIGIPRHVHTSNPINIEHILKSPEFHNALADVFGGGIFNANGEEWKFQRKTASNIFNIKNFRDHFTDIFVEELDFMVENIWDKAAESHEVIDFQEIMYKFTLDSFIRIGFGAKINSLGNKSQVPFAVAFDSAQRLVMPRFVNSSWPITESIQRTLFPWIPTVQTHLKVIDKFAHKVIEERREQLARGEEHGDILSRFMTARDLSDKKLGNTELRDVVLNFIIAGRDTTAQALSWTFYMLMCHPRVEKKLLDEINNMVPVEIMHDPVELYKTVKNMNYAHAVFYEVLRLYPSVPLNQKYALNDDIWPDGTHIRKGDYILWAPYGQGRNEALWGPDAKLFKPERWILDDGRLNREPSSKWTAFHGGPRACLGQNLATLEALVAIIFLVRRYKFSLSHAQDITYQVSLTLPMKYGMKVSVQRR
ncbi:cytochrome P450 [Phycomyces nitens]|nr:cytochrome P450 [Phycomyces nitens]